MNVLCRLGMGLVNDSFPNQHSTQRKLTWREGAMGSGICVLCSSLPSHELFKMWRQQDGSVMAYPVTGARYFNTSTHPWAAFFYLGRCDGVV